MKRVAKLCKLGGLIVVMILLNLGDYTPFAFAASPPTPTTVTVQPTPPSSTAPDLIITSMVGSSLPDYIEVFNQASSPLRLSGWSIIFTTHDASIGGCADRSAEVNFPDAWLPSKHYSTFERTDSPMPDSLSIPFQVDSAALLMGCATPKLASVAIFGPDSATEQSVVLPASWSGSTETAAQHKQRGNALSSTRVITNIFDTDYKIVTGALALNSDPLYTPPGNPAGLQILEILPNARDCSPTDNSSTCSDYVKIYNPTDQPIDLSAYHLRVGYKGQSASVTNTFTWGSDIDPSATQLLLPAHEYFMLISRNDGQPLSLTDTGNYVWLEDAYGTTTYQPIAQYPDASATSKVGQAWAFDGTTWRWTSSPQPGAANYFPPAIVTPAEPSTTASVTTILKPCASNQYRNPITSRCKLLVTNTSSLTPCPSGQVRNPATNRCRSSVTLSSSLTPCAPGSERNPDTNRCRKVGAVEGVSTTTVKDVASPSVNPTGWFVAALAIALATGYGIYEWRQDIALRGRSMLRRAMAWRKQQ